MSYYIFIDLLGCNMPGFSNTYMRMYLWWEFMYSVFTHIQMELLQVIHVSIVVFLVCWALLISFVYWLYIYNWGLKLGPLRGLKLGPQRGLKLGPQRGLKLGPRWGLKLGPRGGLKLGPQWGLKWGPQQGLKLGPLWGLKLAPLWGLKLGPQRGLKSGPQWGLKLGPQWDFLRSLPIQWSFPSGPDSAAGGNNAAGITGHLHGQFPGAGQKVPPERTDNGGAVSTQLCCCRLHWQTTGTV